MALFLGMAERSDSGEGSANLKIAMAGFLSESGPSRGEMEHPGPAVTVGDTKVVASWSRLSNREQVGRGVGWDAHRTKVASEEELILAAYRAWGTSCDTQLEGDFAFAIWDSTRRQLFAARDVLGIRPFYFSRAPGRFAWASSPALLTSIAWVDATVSQEWLARYVARCSMDWCATALLGVEKLPPGHRLVADLDTVDVRRYRKLDDDAPWEDVRNPHWLSDYKRALDESVLARVDFVGPIGAETSGGLDSSTLVGAIAKLVPHAAETMHTFGFLRHDLEPQYLLETSRMWRITFNHILCPPTGMGMEFARRGWQAVGHPVEHANAISHIPFYELARFHGIGTLHSGHGGDEVVTNTGRKALVELINHGQWRQALYDVQGPAMVRPVRLAKMWMTRKPGDFSQLTAPLRERAKNLLLRPEILQAIDIEDRMRQTATFDAPYVTVNSFILGNRLGPHLSTRTAECSIVAATYGVEYQWPLLDERLVQQYLSTPAIWKYGNGYGRYLHRRAVAGIVPDRIAWKRGKSMQSHAQDNALERRQAPERAPSLGQLHPLLEAIIDRDRVRTLLDAQGSGGSSRVVRNQLHRIDILNNWLNER